MRQPASILHVPSTCFQKDIFRSQSVCRIRTIIIFHCCIFRLEKNHNYGPFCLLLRRYCIQLCKVQKIIQFVSLCLKSRYLGTFQNSMSLSRFSPVFKTAKMSIVLFLSCRALLILNPNTMVTRNLLQSFTSDAMLLSIILSTGSILFH